MSTSFREITETIKNHDLWVNIAISKLRVRFIRTALGPVWEILGTMIFLIFITIIWSRLWGRSFFDYFGFLYTVYAIWKNYIYYNYRKYLLFSELYAKRSKEYEMQSFKFLFRKFLEEYFYFIFKLTNRLSNYYLQWNFKH